MTGISNRSASRYLRSMLAGRSIPAFVILATTCFCFDLYAATATYTYDELNRLTSATIDGGRIEYTYDSAGNIEQVLTPYAVTATKSGTGTGTVADDLGKLDCGDDCEGVYDLGVVATLTATPAPGSAFDGWSGAGCAGTGACVVTVDAIKSVGAAFSEADSTDLQISKTDGLSSVAPGASTTYDIVVANSGPIEVADAQVTDTFPASLSCSYTSTPAGGATGNTPAAGGNISDTLALPVGASVTYTALCDISSDATGTLSNTATVSSAVPDLDPGNNSTTDNTDLVASANLVITKTDGNPSVVAGETTTYTITVANNGPSDVSDAQVSDVFAGVLACTYTSVPSGGATGNTATGVGSISDTLTLPAGASVTYTAPCDIAHDATGVLSNIATVTSAVDDPVPGDESAQDDSTITQSADLSVTKTDGQDTVYAGLSTTYTIGVANAGPSTVTDAQIIDTFPAGLTCTYTSTPADGATGNTASGGGNISDTLVMPPGSSVTYTADCDIAGDASGTLSNTATVSSAATDPVPGNNSATDNSEVEILPDEMFISGFEDP